MLPLALILLLTPAQAWGSPSAEEFAVEDVHDEEWALSLIHISEPTRR